MYTPIFIHTHTHIHTHPPTHTRIHTPHTHREQYAKYRTKRLMWREKEKDKGSGPSNSQPVELPAYGPNETVAYSHYFMPSKFGISRRVFRELQVSGVYMCVYGCIYMCVWVYIYVCMCV